MSTRVFVYSNQQTTNIYNSYISMKLLDFFPYYGRKTTELIFLLQYIRRVSNLFIFNSYTSKSHQNQRRPTQKLRPS